jgi:hypothetical protein
MAFFFQTFPQITSTGQIVINNTNPTFHPLILSKIILLDLFSGKGNSSLLIKPIVQNHLVNNLSTEDAPPSKKFIAVAIEFFEDHDSAASMTFHINLLIDQLTQIVSKLHTKKGF